MIRCYNRGCGQDFDPAQNTDESCQHHPGVPFFHDAYKGWTCCNKKSVDFTEFLNIKGCQLSKHSNEKPPEPEKPPQDDIEIDDVPEPIVEVEPIKPSIIPRADFNSPLITINPIVAASIKQSMDTILATKATKETNPGDGEIPTGTSCKNGGCNCTYESPKSNDTICVYHPGVPIFHEGLKYWSCCTKRTTDFSAFLNQKGCTEGHHKWTKSENENESIKCRYDWHQTGNTVVIAIYAKLYNYEKSFVKVNPIRLNVSLVFPQQNNASFDIDLELRGVIDVNKTKVHMFGTKVEITLFKAEPGHWIKLDFPREVKKSEIQTSLTKDREADDSDSDVDLNSVETINSIRITEA